MRDKRAKYRRWAVVYILLALLMAAVLALLMAAGVYKTLVGVLCMVVVAADMAFLVAGSTYLCREGWREA
jgi:fatty-acid desaturase